jgi:sterol desaturase/sphingolipid hydroxylase (fatty acid hydroxylase superfamily)
MLENALHILSASIGEGGVRLVLFLGVLSLFLILESCYPKRKVDHFFSKRRINNISLSLINTIILRLFSFLLATQAALFATTHEVGLLNLDFFNELPNAAAIIGAVICLDFIIYWQHRLFHTLPILWKFHRVHHSDQQLDSTSALRFHTIEILLSMLIKSSVVMSLGCPVAAVVAFEILLSTCAIFNHSNLRIPLKTEASLRLILITPDIHRIHHSQQLEDSNQNFGFSVSLWDRLFNSFREQSSENDKHNRDNYPLGVKDLSEQQCISLAALIKQPFHK